MENALVSIIIPTYNRAHLLAETLNSILEQTYTNWECVIINDNSTDNTFDVLKNYTNKDNRFKSFNLPQEYLKGGNGARNYGFELSKGDYISWFDDDDVMLKDCLKTKIEAFTNDVNFVIGSHYLVDQNLSNQKVLNMDEQSYLFKDYVLWKLKLITGSVLFRKDFLENKVLFNEKLTRGQETEFFSRIFFQAPKNSYKIINIPLFLYRQHIHTKTNEDIKFVETHKVSQAYTGVEILKKSFKLKDKELVEAYYKYLINLFFRSFENKHIANAKFILNNLVSVLKDKNKVLVVEMGFLGNLFLLFSRGIYKIEKRWKLKSINI